MDKFLKNIDYSQVVEYAGLVNYAPGQVVSRTLAQNGKVSITLFVFDEGEEISSHSSKGDALIYVFEGEALITIGDEEYVVTGGQSIVMPHDIPHAVFANSRFKMMLTVVFPVK